MSFSCSHRATYVDRCTDDVFCDASRMLFFFFSSLALWRSRLAKLIATTMADDESWYLAELVEAVNKGLATEALFGTAEATAACVAMHDAEELMYHEGIVYKL